MKLLIERKDWDSDFFGYEIYEYKPQIFDSALLIDNLGELEQLEILLLSIASSEELSSLADGIILADTKVLFKKQLHTEVYNSGCNIFSFPSDGDFTLLVPLALRSGAFSRFKNDQQFNNNEFERLYTEWIRVSVNRKIADEIFVYSLNEQIVGLITIALHGKCAKIGLLAVEDNHQNEGIGKKLIAASSDYASKNGCLEIEVVTQIANTQACKFYKKSGFEINNIEYIYHMWLTK